MIDEKKLIEDVEKEIEFAMKCNMPEMVAGMWQIASIIENQPKVGEWIPCSERLPEAEDLHEISIEKCMCYLIQRRCGVMNVAHYIKVYGEPYFEAHCIKFKDVIAWMPLPNPYRPEKESE